MKSKDGAWEKIAIDLNKRPVEGVTGEGLCDDNIENHENNKYSSFSSLSMSDRRKGVLDVLGKYGIFDNKVV
jgi:GDP-L-fucose synthase